MFMFGIRVCGSCFGIQVLDTGLGMRFLWFRFGFRLGIRVRDTSLRFWFGIQV